MNTQTKNWNDLPGLMETHILTNHDEKCLEEIKSVLERYDLTNKFGVSLLHKHFEIAEDELLLEKNDPITKELILRPVKITNNMDLDYAVTQWRFDGGVRYGCCYCNNNHCDTADQ